MHGLKWPIISARIVASETGGELTALSTALADSSASRLGPETHPVETYAPTAPAP